MQGDVDEKLVVNSREAMSIPEPILVVYSESLKAITTSDLRQARVDEFLASRSLQPKSRKAYQADLLSFLPSPTPLSDPHPPCRS